MRLQHAAFSDHCIIALFTLDLNPRYENLAASDARITGQSWNSNAQHSTVGARRCPVLSETKDPVGDQDYEWYAWDHSNASAERLVDMEAILEASSTSESHTKVLGLTG